MREDITQKTSDFREWLADLTDDEIQEIHALQRASYDDEYSRFAEAYESDECYLCGKPFKTISKKFPCLHWLLRRGKFKKKDFQLIYQKFDYHQFASFLRWVANAEVESKNINDLKEESIESKVFETTIVWKNIEWTLDCSISDYNGHDGTKSDYPHWHFQMRIDNKRFIDFNNYHIPFSETDLLKLSFEGEDNSNFRHTFGYAGQGMQEVMDAFEEDTDTMLNELISVEDESEAAVHINGIFSNPDGIPGELVQQAIDESIRTGKPMTLCLSELLGDDSEVKQKTLISPAKGVPKIARRSGGKGK